MLGLANNRAGFILRHDLTKKRVGFYSVLFRRTVCVPFEYQISV